MSEPPKSKDGDEICPICNKEKSKHLSEEMLAMLSQDAKVPKRRQ